MRKIHLNTLILFIILGLSALVHAETVYGPSGFSATNKNLLTGTYYHLSARAINLDASAESGKIIIQKQDDSEFERGYLFFNLKAISLEQFLKGSDTSLEISVGLRKENYLIVYFAGDKDATITVTLDDGAAVAEPVISSFTATPEAIDYGESLTLAWEVENADTVSIDNSVGEVDTEGTATVSPEESLTYTLTATNSGGEATATVDVTVNIDPPTASMSVSPDTIANDESATLTWTSENAASCSITPDIGSVETSGSETVSPEETTTYVMTVLGLDGTTVTASATLTVTSTPVLSVTSDLISIDYGDSAEISWAAENADAVYIDQGIGDVTDSDSVTVTPEATTTYTITAMNADYGTVSATVTVEVLATPEAQSEGTFGYIYNDIIPEDATIEAYDEDHFSLLTGEVQDEDGFPLEGVSISIHSHGEYGTVLTDEDGAFTIPVEGGGNLRVIYTKGGYITSHRQVYVGWNDYGIAETITMLAVDENSTTITFDGDSTTITSHTSTEISDDDGARSATLVFSGDNMAYLMDENGNDVQALTTVTVRATEYATPESMPAKLPATSAYTYCNELQVDGAARVRFENSVPLWVDNFLGFDVGEVVPVGYYDRDRGAWVPSDNGVVVELLDDDADGVVDGLDADGDGEADDLDEDGSTSDEVAGLTDTTRFEAGVTFWRAEVDHFTPWDCNWPYAPPADATLPNGPDPDPNPELPSQDCSTETASYVKHKTGVLHEDIPIPGTGLSLHYASNRTKGYQYIISIPASGDTVPDSLKSIIVKLEIAGRTYTESLSAEANQDAEFVWDGKDHLGNWVEGLVVGKVSIGFVYDLVYTRSSSSFTTAWAQAGSDLTAVEGREDFISWKHSTVTVSGYNSNYDYSPEEMGNGWSLSNHHKLLNSKVLVKGSGTLESVAAGRISMITTVAGNGDGGYSGDNGPATSASLYRPAGVSVDANGNLFIADYYNHCVRKVDTDGIITTVAGTGDAGYSGDNGAATSAELDSPWSVSVDADGNLFIAEMYNHCIRKVDTDGIITTVAGTGDAGYSGDNGAATSATLYRPRGVSVDANGNLFIADTSNACIRKVDTDGIITTVAGTGDYGYFGDNGPATSATLRLPMDVSVDANGNLFIADSNNNRIRKVDTSGIITTVAGTGDYGYSGDNGAATSAELYYPYGVSVDTDGNLFIADTSNHCIRKVDTGGIITTVAGTEDGEGGYSGDNGAATSAELRYPRDVSVDADGNLFIADTFNRRIRKVYPSPLAQKLDAISTDLYVPDQNDIKYIFSPAGRHLKTMDYYTGIIFTTFGYDSDGNLISTTDRFDNTTTIERDAGGYPTAIVSPYGHTTTLSVDSEGNLTAIDFEDGTKYSFGYTDEGLMTSVIDPGGFTSTHSFSDIGRVMETEDPENGIWTLDRTTYTDGSVDSSITSSEGNTTTHTTIIQDNGDYTSFTTHPTEEVSSFERTNDNLNDYSLSTCGMTNDVTYTVDEYSRLKIPETMTTSTPAGLTTEITLTKTYIEDDDGLVDVAATTIDANGKTTTILVDNAAGTETLTSPAGRIFTRSFDLGTLLTSETQTTGLFATSYDYDGEGRLTGLTTGDRTASFTYSSRNNLATITDPLGRTTTYSYDLLDRPTTIEYPDGASAEFQYDDAGNLIVLTTPVPADNEFAYNGVNKLSRQTSPLGSYTSYSYDTERKLTGITLPSGKTIVNTYSQGRLSRTDTEEWTNTYTYFCSNLPETITRGDEVLSFQYDGTLPTSVTQSGTINATLELSYNDDFQATSFTYAGDTQSYLYDDDGLLTTAGDFTITRDIDTGLPTEVSNGTYSLARTFNGYGEIEATSLDISGTTAMAMDLSRNDNGQITSRTINIAGTEKTYDYTYDDNGRLLTVSVDGTLTEEYSYDANGNRTYQTNNELGITGRTFTHSIEDHTLTAGAITYGFDNDDNLASRTEGTETTDYSYSSTGELLSVILPDDTQITYINDPSGRRIAKLVDGVIVEKYLWSGFTTLLAVYDGSDNLIQRFEYADGRMPVAMNQEGVTYYLGYDQVGSLRVVSDSVGNVIKRIDYDSFGNIIADTNESFEVPFGFAGGLYDPDTGLVRFGYRDYMPEIGKWTAKDPIGFAGGDSNLYGYVQNDPVNFVDPFGLGRVKDRVLPAANAVVDTLEWADDMGKINDDLGKAGQDNIDAAADLLKNYNKENFNKLVDAQKRESDLMKEKIRRTGEYGDDVTRDVVEIIEPGFSVINDLDELLEDASEYGGACKIE